MRIAPHWVIAFLGLSLAGVSIDAARAKPGASLADEVSAHVTPFAASSGPAPKPLAAALVLHRDDCTGNFRMFNLLHRRDVRAAIAVAVVWYAGAASDSSAIRRTLPTWMMQTRLRPVPRNVVRELNRLGHHSTPVLLMLDDSTRLRLVSQSPRSAREFAGLHRIITGLTWSEER